MNPDKEKRPRRTDFSDALRHPGRGIEEVNTRGTYEDGQAHAFHRSAS